MFEDNLSMALLRLLDEKNLTQEQLAEASDLSFRFINKIIGKKSSPTITSLEKICSALDISPNELLLPEKINHADPKQVVSIQPVRLKNTIKYLPICPHCAKTLSKEHVVYCEHCFGKLLWNHYYKANINYSTFYEKGGK